MALGVNDVLRVTAQIRHPSSATRTQGVFHYQVSDIVSDVFADVRQDMLDRMAAAYDIVKALFSSDAVSDGMKMLNVSKKETYGKKAWTFTGTGSPAEELPPQTAAEILFYTADAGRFGRKYLGPLEEPSQDSGLWAAGTLAALDAFGVEMMKVYTGSTTTNTYLPGVARKVAGVWNFKQFAEAIGHFSVVNVRTQRRRTSGFGLT